MKTMRLLVLVHALAAACWAGEWVDMEQGAKASAIAVPGTEAELVLPRAFLGRPVLHYAGIVATSRPNVDLGVVRSPTQWVFEPKDGVVAISELPRPFADPGDGPTALGEWRGEPAGDGVKITEIKSMYEVGDLYSRKTDTSPELRISAVAPAYAVQVTTSEISFCERYYLSQPDSGTTTPAQPDVVAYRRHLLLREPVLKPRPMTAADAASVGLFSLAKSFRASPGDEGDMVLRWNLEKPIRCVLHPTVPEAYRATVTRALESWNQAFQDVAGTRPLTVEVGDQATVPGTPGVVVVYWVDKARAREYRGVAGSFAHPVNGEMLGGQILLSEAEIFGYDQDYNRTQELEDLILPPIMTRAQEVSPAAGGAPVAIGEPAPKIELAGAPFDPALIERGLEGTVAHEMGHVLGLRHNFKASADAARIAPGEMSTSVMDYMRQSTKPLHPLAYDRYALALAQGLPLKPEFAGPFLLGSDDKKATDPVCNAYDEGVPLEWAMRGITALRRLGRDPGVLEHSSALMNEHFSCYDILAKYLPLDADANHEQVMKHYEAMLADQGADPVVGGGTDGKPEVKRSKVAPDVLESKKGFERIASMIAMTDVAGDAGLSSATIGRLAAVLVPVAVDAPRTDLFCVRYNALKLLIGMKSLLALESVRQVHAQLSAREVTEQDGFLRKMCTDAINESGAKLSAIRVR